MPKMGADSQDQSPPSSHPPPSEPRGPSLRVVPRPDWHRDWSDTTDLPQTVIAKIYSYQTKNKLLPYGVFG
ncbi:hypothetical protein R50073_04850 [Maricurvus nonylphenolicus]